MINCTAVNSRQLTAHSEKLTDMISEREEKKSAE